jgi:hypothetical protein
MGIAAMVLALVALGLLFWKRRHAGNNGPHGSCPQFGNGSEESQETVGGVAALKEPSVPLLDGTAVAELAHTEVKRPKETSTKEIQHPEVLHPGFSEKVVEMPLIRLNQAGPVELPA